ncbi:factor activating pos9 [Vermiconidia calcicola]|uniref:Factor activating pos9 n=1 Tax=Vermiconidia calcicola TaxID=1690605 RepID=A0ACC3NEA9_9PEZI|nr:factor activating pos9 [Vermiconidia calcicola]
MAAALRTPGVGKSTISEELSRKTGLKHLSVTELAKKHNISTSSEDPEDPSTRIVDEDRLLDVLENDLEDGGTVIDWHACDLFPPRLIDLVCVIRCDNKILYDRLKARNYAEKKLQENMDCEIMEVLLQEARDAYDSEIVVELKSEKTEDIDSNVDRIEQWITQWKKDHGEEGDEVNAQQQDGGKKDEDDPMFLHG